MLTQHLRDYFLANDTPDANIKSLWNVHKTYLHRILIQLGAQAKRAYSAELQNLLCELQTLETKNKSHPDPSTTSNLTKPRLDLHSLFSSKIYAPPTQITLLLYA